jgi:DNA-binding response OmpR family regulator
MHFASKSDPVGTRVVAVLDDDQTLSSIVCRVLRACGLHADAFCDACAFGDAVTQRRYDAFVLDWQLADVTAKGVIRSLRETFYPTSPIFLYTARSAAGATLLEREIALLLTACRVEFRQKPYSHRALALEIKEALEAAPFTMVRPAASER